MFRKGESNESQCPEKGNDGNDDALCKCEMVEMKM